YHLLLALFSYTTLFRSHTPLRFLPLIALTAIAASVNKALRSCTKSRFSCTSRADSVINSGNKSAFARAKADLLPEFMTLSARERSEEHTSELQSRFDLV